MSLLFISVISKNIIYVSQTCECVWRCVAIVIGYCVSPFYALNHVCGGGWMSGSGNGSYCHACSSGDEAGRSVQRLRLRPWCLYLQS